MGDSALFTGKGTPWGPMETFKPNVPDFITDPNTVEGFDYSPQRLAARENTAAGAGRASEQALASLGRAGIQGADTARAMADIGSAQTAALAKSEGDLALAEWKDRLQLMDSLNNARAQKYAMEANAYGQEQAGRGQFYNGLLGAGGAALGGWLGGD